MPEVTVIVITYNRAEFLRSAITSVLNQSFQDYEIIIVVDGSTDKTQEVVNNFHDKRIKCIFHESNKGEAIARNTGIRNSNSEYITFLDDDDEWLPEKLKLQVDLLKISTSKVGAVYTGYILVDRTKKKSLGKSIPKKRGDIYTDMVTNYVGIPSAVMLRKKCFERVNVFDESIPYAIDYDMWIRISKEFHFEYIKEPLIKYCIHEGRLSNNLELKVRGMEVVFKKHSQLFALKNGKKAMSRFYTITGMIYYRNGDIKRGVELTLKAIKVCPFYGRTYIYLVLRLLLNTNELRRIKNLLSLFPYFRNWP